MRFRRYPLLPTAAIVLIILVVIAIVVQIFRQTNFVAAWIFNFVNGWAAALSASAAVILVVIYLATIQENRRNGALNRIRAWAKEAIRTLSLDNGQDVTGIGTQVSVSSFEGSAMVREARWWPDLQVKVIKAVNSLEALSNASNRKAKSTELTNLMAQAIVTFVAVLESASGL